MASTMDAVVDAIPLGDGIYGQKWHLWRAGLLQSERHKAKLTVRIGNEEQR